MPRLEKIRLTHIQYNNKHNVIRDEILDLKGQSTLLKLANGGGKSVMTQMLLAPYVSTGAKRNFKGRPFLDYFKDEAPSFIVEEWKMDESSSRFLIGFMVRKSNAVAREEDGYEKKADLYAFIAEYKEPCEYDIEHLPLLGESNGRKIWLTFSKARDLLVRMNNEHDRNFFWYNMNNTSHRQKYAEKLAELGIERSEWDQLQTFNQDESGLSAFCDTYNTEEKLVKNVFIPAVAAKIDEENSPNQLEKPSVMDAMQKNMKSFALQQLDNQDKLDQKKDYETFLAFLQDLSGQTEALAALEQEQKDHMDKLICQYLGAHEARESAQDSLEQLQDHLGELQKEKGTIEYEILSSAYWKNAAQMEKKEQQLTGLKEKESQLDVQVQQETIQLNRIDCARVYQQGLDLKGRIAYFQEKVEAALRSDEETRVQMEVYAGGLKVLYEKLIEENSAEISKQKTKLDDLNGQLQAVTEEDTTLQNKRVDTERAISAGQTILDAYRNREDAFVSKWKISIPHTLEPWKDQGLLEKVLEEQKESAGSLEEDLNQSLARQSALEKSLEKLSTRQRELELQETRLSQELDSLKKDKDQKDQILKERENLLRRLGTRLDLIWDIPAIEKAAASRRQSLEQRLRLNLSGQAKIEREKAQLETGCVLELSEPIIKVLDSLGIEPLTGVNWLREAGMHYKTKEKMIRDYPWLPYCLLMSKDQETQFFKALEEQKLYTAQPIPVLDRDALNENPQEVLNPASGLRVYVRFNEQLIAPSRLQELLESLERRLEEEQKQQNILQEEQQDLEKSILQAQLDYTREAYNHLLDQINAASESLDKLHQQRTELELSLARTRQNLKTLQSEIHHKNDQLDFQKSLLERLEELMDEYAKAAEASLKMENDKEFLETLLERMEACRSKQKELRRNISDGKDQLGKLNRQHADLEKEFRKYEKSEARTPELSLEELQNRYNALQSKLGASDLQENQEQLEKSRTDLAENQTSLKQMEEAFHLNFSDYETLKAGMPEYLHQKTFVSQLEDDLKALRLQISETASRLAALQERCKSSLDRIAELNGKTEPLPKEKVRTIDLKAEKKTVEGRIESVEADCAKTDRRIQGIQSVIDTASGWIDHSLDIDAYDPDPQWTGMPLSLMKEAMDRWKGRSDSLAEQVRKMEASITQALHNQSRRYPSTQEVLLEVLAGLERIVEQPSHLHETLLEKKALIDQDLARLEEDLKNLEEQKEQTARILYDYVERMHRNIKKIDANTTITVRDHTRKMLEIGMMDFDKNKDLYHQKCREMVESILDSVLKDPDHLDTIVETNLTPVNLYNAVIGIHTISVHVYKR